MTRSRPYPLHPLSTCQLTLESLLERILFPIGKKAFGFKTKRATDGGDESHITTGRGDAAAPGGFFRPVMRRVPPFPAVRQSGDVFLGRGRGARDGELLEAGAAAAMPVERACAVLLHEAGHPVDDHETIRDLDYPTLAREIAIVKSALPLADSHLVEEAVQFVQRLRREDLAKIPGIAETLDWVSALFKLGHNNLPEDMANVLGTLGCLLKTREDRFLVGPDRLRQLVEGRRSVGVAEKDAAQPQVAL